MLVGGGLSSVPRIARELGIWVPKDEAVEVLAAILDEWREDLRYRVSRVKARLKFMIDDIGPEGMRERVEARLGRTFDDFRLPPLPRADQSPRHSPTARRAHYVGVPVHLGLVSGDQMIALADLAEDARRRHPDHAPAEPRADERVRRPARRGARAARADRAPARRGRAARRRRRLHRRAALQLLRHRDEDPAWMGSCSCSRSASARDADGLRMHLDGCPHACAQHWVGDLGFQGTTVRDAAGRRRQAYDIYLRGSLDRPAAIARAVFRRVPTEELDDAVAGLVGGWVAGRAEGETFRSFCDRSSDDELAQLAGREAHQRGNRAA